MSEGLEELEGFLWVRFYLWCVQCVVVCLSYEGRGREGEREGGDAWCVCVFCVFLGL